MKRVAVGLVLGLALAACGSAGAKQAVIDFTGDTPVANGLKQVNNSAGSDGVTQIMKKGDKNVACTGGTDQARYLYLALDPAFKTGLKSVWVTVEYFDEGKGGFKLQYDGQDDAHQTAADPPTGLNFDTQQFQHQTWHIVGFKLQGGQEGGADIRLDDRAGDDRDGALCVSKVTVSDEDPDFTRFPYAVNKIAIDGKVDAGEWDNAYKVTLDRAQQDAFRADTTWKGPEDFSGTYSFKWDENALYILGQVRDATPRLNDKEAPEFWNGDGAEFALGLDDSDPERTNVVPTDFKVTIGVGTKPGWQIRNEGEDKAIGDSGNNLVVTNTSDGYLFELQIPWTILNGATVKAGQRIAWSMFANNSREVPSAQQMALNPFGRTDTNRNASGWARAVLEPKP
jgi:Carbohydrate family 9 binding domain-like